MRTLIFAAAALLALTGAALAPPHDWYPAPVLRDAGPVPQDERTGRVMVAEAAYRHQIPIRVAVEQWQEECWQRIRCRRGAHGEYGPFQIRAIAARDAGCKRGWASPWLNEESADCAMRYLAKVADYCGDGLGRRLGWYNGGKCQINSYARRVLARARRA